MPRVKSRSAQGAKHKGWFKRCVSGVRKSGGAEDPEAVCGAVLREKKENPRPGVWLTQVVEKKQTATLLKRLLEGEGAEVKVSGRTVQYRYGTNPKSVLTKELARAAATDAGNRSMRKGNRTAWNEDDYNVAVKEFDRLLKHVKENPSQDHKVEFYSAGELIQTQMLPGKNAYGQAGQWIAGNDQRRVIVYAPNGQVMEDSSQGTSRARLLESFQKPFKRNPEDAAEEMFESFHGEPSDETVVFEEEEHYHGNLSALGDLVELKVRTLSGYDVTLGFEQEEGETKSNPFWPFNSFTKTTIQHVGTGRKYGVVGQHKGYQIYKEEDGENTFVVPKLDKDSRFESLKDAKSFIGQWSKNPGGPKGYKAVKEFFKVFNIDIIHNADPPRAMSILSKETGIGYGVEHIDASEFTKKALGLAWLRGIDYVNMGDAYTLTLIHDGKDYRLGSWGDFVEKYGKPQKNPGPFGSALKAGRSVVEYADRRLGKALGNPAKYIVSAFSKDPKKENFFWSEGHWSFDSEASARKYFDELSREGYSVALASTEGLVANANMTSAQAVKRMTVPRNRNPEPVSKTVLLCSNESGDQLYLQGGDQSLDLASIHMDGAYEKDSMVIGEAYFCSYLTRKDFDKFKPIIYEHELGEETGECPLLRYDRLNAKLYLDGGQYRIEKPLVGTSPGLEN